MGRNSVTCNTRTDNGSNYITTSFNDLFLVVKDVNFASYASDNTIYQ